MSYVWTAQSFSSAAWLKLTYSCILKDQFLTNWSSEVQSLPKCTTYRIFKENLTFEKNLLVLPRKLAKDLSRFRVSNHSLPIEMLRYSNVPREERLCPLCDTREIGDEYHYIFKCPHFRAVRREFLPSFCWQNASTIKLKSLFNKTQSTTLQKLAHFISRVTSSFLLPPS